MRISRFTQAYQTTVFKKGALMSAVAAAAAVVFILINTAVSFLPSNITRIDVTEQQYFTLSEQTENILSELSEKVEIYHLCASGKQDDKIAELLLKYAAACSNLEVSVIDTTLYPNFYKDYSDSAPTDNSVIISSSQRSRLIDYYDIYTASDETYAYYGYYDVFGGEGQITSAIDFVVSGNLPKIYLLEGHAENELPSELKKALSEQNFDIEPLNLKSKGNVPNDSACVMIYSPKRDLSQDEFNALRDYSESGGGLMIVLDYHTEPLTLLESLLSDYGISAENGIVFENDADRYASNYQYFIFPTLLEHEITHPLLSSNLHPLFPIALGLNAQTENEAITINVLAVSGDDSYLKTDINSTDLSQTEDDLQGPFALGISAEKDSQRLAVFSTSQFLDSSINKTSSGANYDLFINSVCWLCGKSDSISIHPKYAGTTGISSSRFSATVMFILLVIIIPGMLLISAFIITKKRKRK